MIFLFDTINATLIAIAILNLLLGFIILFAGRNRRVNVVFGFNIVAMIGWILGMILFRSAIPATDVIWCTVLYIAPTFIASSFLYFTYIFPTKTDADIPLKGAVIFLINAIVVGMVARPGFIIEDVNVRMGLEKGIVFSNHYWIYALYIVGFFFFSFVRILKKIRNSVDSERSQLIYLLIGYFVTANLSFVTNLILPWIGYFELNWLGQVSTLATVSFTAFAILRFSFLDLRIFGSQTLVLFILFLIGLRVVFSGSLEEFLLDLSIFLLTASLGFFLVRSVKKEVNRKNELQEISTSLALANQRLKELDNTKTEFISIASHQLRTPLTAIKGYLSLVLEGSYGKISSELRDVMEKMYSVNGHLIQLVEDLLNISRIETGRVQYRFEPIRLEALIAEEVDMFLPIAKSRGLSLRINLPRKPLPKMLLDENKMKEVVSNLIDNALKYTKEGSVTVSVDRGESGMARVSVRDTGIGFSPEEKKKLFKKFLRSKETTKIAPTGTGLGLYVGKNFVEAHGGRMSAKSEGVGTGATFIVELPIRNPYAKNAEV